MRFAGMEMYTVLITYIPIRQCFRSLYDSQAHPP